MIVNQKKWPCTDNQTIVSGKNEWRVSRLIELSKDLDVFDMPIVHIDLLAAGIYNDVSIREMVMHFKAIKKEDLSYPIIFGEDGDLLDGRHRLMKALMKGKKTIKAVRFKENPERDWVAE